ncbi:MAG: sugar transferase, partial [Verrucomicrobiae bacterium]|nr:sugar transferase [Verrucomicrobiae bacterium]
VLLAALRNRSRGEPLFLRRSAVAPSEAGCTLPQREVVYCELNGLPGLWRRWPQLWSIARGDFAWVGNRPLTRAEATQLETEFEQLWLTVPIGLVGLADTHGCSDPADLETRAHSSFYAARREARLNRQILRWFLRQLFPNPQTPEHPPNLHENAKPRRSNRKGHRVARSHRSERH